ncbi:uncharacterized protein C8A04DRAFT_36332 [Dichotomopilus funicola]|uniref:Beta-glucuronidase C-terminal domain-containing protein n=1 Tax=Dichotomopilus funicola TaxID=1934379 RepID=A0AAN6V4K2_9PEZI|nr:hypothetical protein C8A04DRAFT_36332 [Dichotomopilus funicola]
MKQASLVYSLASPALVKSQATVASSVDSNDVLDGYVSYSIEFSSFPEFAGNDSHPNTFSDTLLDNLGQFLGRKPYIRVGGNTQDYALYDASLPIALNGTVDPDRSPDYPTTITIGPSYFESYTTWKDVKFSHGFNLGLGGSKSEGWQTLLDTVPLACQTLGDGKLYLWEYGNEPDLFSTSAQGPVRSSDWNEAQYVQQWQNGTRQIKALLEEHCPELTERSVYGYLAPSFAGTGNTLKAADAWAEGLNDDKDITFFSTHNGAASPGVTLQGTLMNHAVTKRSVDAHVDEYNAILSQSSSSDDPVPPLIFGETNSLYNQGRPGLSNTFGAALWGVDFNLYSASVGFKRVHMHMGTNYRYAAWQPVLTDLATLGTKAPYYGSITVAAALGSDPATVVSIPLTSSSVSSSSSSTASTSSTSANSSDDNANTSAAADDLQPEAAYAIYTSQGTHLTRLVILNMRSYNTTRDGAGLEPVPSPPPRGETEYAFALDITGASSANKIQVGQELTVRRLLANGSDAITGITWDGWSYNYELEGGKPVRLDNVTVGETVVVGEDGVVKARGGRKPVV